MTPPAALRGEVALPIPYRYALRPAPDGPAPLLVVATHGYGQDEEGMLALADRAAPRLAVASLRAPHPHHRFGEGRSRTTGYGWVSDRDPAPDVANHHRFVELVAERAVAAGALRAPRVALFAFSQSVSLAYRLAAARPDLVAGVVGVAGAAPSDWGEGGGEPRLRARVLHVAPTGDEAYPLERARRFRAVLESRCDDVTWLEPPGGHRVPRSALPAIGAWLERLAGVAPAQPGG